jgi:uncharacterized protein YcbK (DUF882 family)
VRPVASLFALGAVAASTFTEGRPVAPPPPPPIAPALPVVAPPPPPVEAPPIAAWATALPALRFVNTRTGAAESVRLYAPTCALDEEAAAAVDRVAAERDAPARALDRRLLRLVVKAAAHFHAAEVDLVSTLRDGARSGSRHRTGEAADFRLPGVPAPRVAAYLRGLARVGVGVYTHPRTLFVHLDVRAESYHWADASPPGRWWRESRMTDRAAPARDAAWKPEQDLP